MCKTIKILVSTKCKVYTIIDKHFYIREEGVYLKIVGLKLKNSIFSRLVITFLIIIIPIYGLAIYIYNWGICTVKNEISKSTISQVSYYLKGVEKEIERIKILQYDCLNDEDLNKLAIRWKIMDMYDMTESMIRLQQRLVMINNSSYYIKNISVHILPIGKTISSNNGIDNIDMLRYQKIRASSEAKGAQIIRYKGSLFLSTVQQKLNNSTPLYIIEIELNQDTLKQELSQLNTYKGSGTVLINLNDNIIIPNISDEDSSLSAQNIFSILNKDESNKTGFIKIKNKEYYIVQARSTYLNMVLLKYIPQEFILKPIKNFYIWVWVFTVAVIIIIFIYSFSTYKYMHKPLLELVKSFRKVESGDLKVSVNHDPNNEFGYLYKQFNDMVRNLNMLIDQVYSQQILMQRAELKHLQSQINPHFLYNSFFMINTMARIGDDNLIPFTKHLGEYFRFVTRNSSEYIPLKDEINHAKVYTEIQLMRFSKRLQIQFAECPDRYNSLKVPRLIVQPLIENAFEHGIEKKINGIISIDFEDNEKELNIIVEDNGNDMTDTRLIELQNSLKYSGDELETTGTINIHRRIKLVFGENSGLQVSRSKLGGLKVIMKIKIPGGNDNV
jgi:two-component system sensor histidine kinase YesM